MKKLLIIMIIALTSFRVDAQFNPGKYWPVGFVKATDPDSGSEITYSITAGNTAAFFVVMPCSGIVKVDTAVYSTFTYQRTFTLTFKIADPEGNYIKTTAKVVLKKAKGVKVKPTVIGL